ncbi:MAG: hypothetical protein ACLPVO_14520 [Desulfomonilaceae bacterium]
MDLTKFEKCPRPAKTDKPKRIKLAITMDEELHKRLMEFYAEGYNVSHITDSALWSYFGKPPLSFQLNQPKGKSKKPKEADLFDNQKCCGE